MTPVTGATVLIVDDDPIVRLLLAKLLEVEGYSIRVAMDGREALQIARETLPQVVIADIHMPHVDGLELVGKLRQLAGSQQLAVIFLTASDSFEHLQAGIRLQAVHFIHKPFSNDALVRVVRDAVQAMGQLDPKV